MTGGGTGGHVYPAIAIAEALAERYPDVDVLFAGKREGLEARLVPQAGLPLAFVASEPLERRRPWALPATVTANVRGIAQAARIARRFRPDIVVATGGYVAFPVALGARLAIPGVPIALLEPNAVAGLSNRLLAPFVDEIWLGADAEAVGPKSVRTGIPLRATVTRTLAPQDARRALDLDPNRTTIVVLGGSQGARRLSDAARALEADAAARGWQVLIVVGTGDPTVTAASDAIRTLPYLDDPALAYAAADLVVARAGASTLAELRATGTPALLVPYPHATADHQTRNATRFVATGAGRIIADGELDGPRLARELDAALQPAALAALRASARVAGGGDARAAIVARVAGLLEARVKRARPANG